MIDLGSGFGHRYAKQGHSTVFPRHMRHSRHMRHPLSSHPLPLLLPHVRSMINLLGGLSSSGPNLRVLIDPGDKKKKMKRENESRIEMLWLCITTRLLRQTPYSHILSQTHCAQFLIGVRT
jgi:hypothetical protein